MEPREMQELVQRIDSEGSPFTAEHYDGRYYHYIYGYQPVCVYMDDLKTFKTRPDDVWVTGAARSGTRWLREIAGMLQNGTADYHSKGDDGNIEQHGVQAMEDLPSPRLLKIHLPPSFLPTVLNNPEGGKVLHIIRNPKDVAVSWYNMVRGFKSMQYEGRFSGFLPTYLDGQAGNPFSWFELVKEWWTKYKSHLRVHFLFYEELQQDPQKHIKEIATFIGCDYDQQFYLDVVNKTSFKNMSKAKQYLDTTTTMFKSDAHLFRKGKVGGWKEIFTETLNEYCDKRFEDEMKDVPDLKERIQF